MDYAPAKPLSADMDIIQTRPPQVPRYAKASWPSRIIYPAAQDLYWRYSHDYSQTRDRLNTSFAYNPPPHQTEYIYSTSLSRRYTSRISAQPSRRPAPPTTKGGFPYRGVYAIVVLLGVGAAGAGLYSAFTLLTALKAIISQYIPDLGLG